MVRNILLTSLDALESEQALRYYAAQNEFGSNYCEAMQSMEASTKLILARFPIDEILVIDGEGDPEGGNQADPLRVKEANALYSAEPGSLSAFDLYRSRIAQYIDEMSLEQQAYDKLLPEEARSKLIDFIRDFQEKHSQQEMKRINRFFDELARDRPLYEQFRDALFAAFPEARKDSGITMKWVKNYLYAQMKLTGKLEILPVNESVCVRYFPAAMLEKREYWFNSILETEQDDDEINLFVSLGNGSAVDDHLVLNILNILITTPGSQVHLKKMYRVYEPSGNLTGEIVDSTSVTRSTDLAAAAHAFLNYAKTDMLVDFWENSGEHNERISSLVYAARHVDVGISMCNIPEVQEGIRQLFRLLNDARSWKDTGDYGLVFGVIAGCIQADYSEMVEEDGSIPFIRLIKWAYKHQLYQQVLTLIESYAPTSLVKSGIFYYCDDEAHAAEVTDLLALQRLELKPYEYYKMDDIEHYFVKNYDRGSVRLSGARGEDRNKVYAALRAQSVEKHDPEKISGHTACSISTLQNVLYAYYRLGEVRNKISHADADAMAERRLNVSESDISYAMIWMRESIEHFIKSFDAAMEEVRGKNPKIVPITADDVRNAADRIRRERTQGGRQHANKQG